MHEMLRLSQEAAVTAPDPRGIVEEVLFEPILLARRAFKEEVGVSGVDIPSPVAITPPVDASDIDARLAALEDAMGIQDDLPPIGYNPFDHITDALVRKNIFPSVYNPLEVENATPSEEPAREEATPERTDAILGSLARALHP